MLRILINPIAQLPFDRESREPTAAIQGSKGRSTTHERKHDTIERHESTDRSPVELISSL
ncbi:hypothetical protein WN55_02180 [Dufourea novaeangliae]|uniref:Uncharacterized protein n=1 Tax=Dufourea novaeangliae TaxID=178035 RepID=A0A154NXI2_DUFNO|nr:hypothetical protein WN55_02180 [Dufourea novaeangliae]